MARTGRWWQGANFKKTLTGASNYYYTSTLAHSRRSAMLSHVPHHQAILKFSVGFPYIRGSSCVRYIVFVPRGWCSLGPCFSPQQQSKLQVRVAHSQYVMTYVFISHFQMSVLLKIPPFFPLKDCAPHEFTTRPPLLFLHQMPMSAAKNTSRFSERRIFSTVTHHL